MYIVTYYIVQLAHPTELQLVGVGVDFDSPLEGRRRKKNNPHLASGRKNDPTCLKFYDCLVGV